MTQQLRKHTAKTSNSKATNGVDPTISKVSATGDGSTGDNLFNVLKYQAGWSEWKKKNIKALGKIEYSSRILCDKIQKDAKKWELIATLKGNRSKKIFRKRLATLKKKRIKTRLKQLDLVVCKRLNLDSHKGSRQKLMLKYLTENNVFRYNKAIQLNSN
jgi:hypothetical protein